MDIKYTGRMDYRVLTAADLSARGVEGFKKTTWTPGETQSVGEEAGAWIVKNVPDFEKVTVTSPSTKTASSTAPDKPDKTS